MKNLMRFIYCDACLVVLLIAVAIVTSINTETTNKEMEYVEVQIEKLEETNKELRYEIEEMIIQFENTQNCMDQLEQRVESLEIIEEVDEITTDDKLNWFVQYKKSFEGYDYGNPESIYDVYSHDDITYLQRMVETECYGADFESKVHVACVAISRVENEKFPNTLVEVITRPNQFCYSRTDISEETILACEYAFMIGSEADGCLWFHSMDKTDTFSGGKYVFTDNAGHHFFK